MQKILLLLLLFLCSSSALYAEKTTVAIQDFKTVNCDQYLGGVFTVVQLYATSNTGTSAPISGYDELKASLDKKDTKSIVEFINLGFDATELATKKEQESVGLSIYI